MGLSFSIPGNKKVKESGGGKKYKKKKRTQPTLHL